MAKIYEALSKAEPPATNQPQSAPSGIGNSKLLKFKNIKQAGDIEKKIFFYNQKNGSKIFNFTCCHGSEGVSTTIDNLIKYIARKKSDKKILLIDANFTRPILHTVLSVPFEKGLTDCLTGNITAQEAIQPIAALSLDFMPCGKNYNSISSSGLQQENLIDLLNELKNQYDYILIDSSPLLLSTDSLAAAVAADVTFLIIQSLKITKEVAERAKTMLVENECVIGGVILNRVQQVIPNWMYKIL